MFNKNVWGSWNDIKLYVLIIIFLLILTSVLQPYFIPFGISILSVVIYFSRRNLHDKELVFSGYLDNVIRNIERTNHFAIRNLDIGMAVFSKEGKLQWKNELFQSWVGQRNLEGKRPEELLPLQENAFETMCVKDDSRVIQLEDRYYLMKYFSVQTKTKNEKKADQLGSKSGLMVFLTDVTELELLRQRYDNERLCLAYVRFDNREDVMMGLSETARANLDGEVGEAISKWTEAKHGFICRANKENMLVGFSYGALRDAMEEKFSILDEVRDIRLENKIAPTLSIGFSVDGVTLEEVSLKAAKSLDLALGRGGDQAVVMLNDKLEFYGGTTNVSAKSTRVRARIVAHTIHEQMVAADTIFVMGHQNEDYDSIGSAIGVAKMALSLKKPTYIVISGRSISLDKIMDMLNNEDIQINANEKAYLDILVEEEEALKAVTPKSLLMIVDHHRPVLSASKGILEAVNTRIIIDHHRRAEDVITDTVLQYMEPSSSSTSELVTELVGYFNEKLEFSKGEATALYAGVVVDTKNFAVQTGERTFEAAALLRRCGADPTLVRQLFKDDFENYKDRYRLIAGAEVPIPGLAITVNRAVAKSGEASILAAQTADSLININGIVVGVAISEFTDGSLGVSARSDGSVNVQLVMEELGGGGHQTVAGVQLQNMRAAEVIPQIIALVKKQISEVEEREANEGNSAAGC